VRGIAARREAEQHAAAAVPDQHLSHDPTPVMRAARRLLVGGQVEREQHVVPHAARALGDIARAKGMTQVARDAGLSRESLYKALSENGNPSFATVLKVARALGVRLHAEAA